MEKRMMNFILLSIMVMMVPMPALAAPNAAADPEADPDIRVNVWQNVGNQQKSPKVEESNDENPEDISTTTTTTVSTTTVWPGCSKQFTTPLEATKECYVYMDFEASTFEEAAGICADEGLELAHPEDPVAMVESIKNAEGFDSSKWGRKGAWIGAKADDVSYKWAHNGEELSSDSPFWFGAPSPNSEDMEWGNCASFSDMSAEQPLEFGPCSNTKYIVCEEPSK